MNIKLEEYQFRIFLKDKNDKKLLKPETKLYGKVIDSTGIVFLSPYKPPEGYWPEVATVIANSNEKVDSGLFHVDIANETVELAIPTVTDIDSEIASSDSTCESTPFEYVFMSAIYSRTPFNKADMDLLWNKKVLILGLGTGGGKIALELARAGIGSMILADPDNLDFANVSRHEGDLLDVGKTKVQVAAERVYQINPAIIVETYHEDIFNRPIDEVKNIFESVDLVIAATDKGSVQQFINQVTQKFKVPCVFGGCYEEALGGEVFFTLPDEEMPCLCCLRGNIKQPDKKAGIDYSTATGPEDYEGQPGLHAAVDFVTCIEIQISLGILMRQSKTSKLSQIINPSLNYLLIGGALSEGFYRFKKPYDIFHQPLTGPRCSCMVCQKINLDNINVNSICQEK